MRRRVVVTGLGIVSPVGSNVESAWQNIKNGVSGIGPIDHYDPSSLAVRFAGLVEGFSTENYIANKDLKKMDTFIHYGMVAGMDAFTDSGLDVNVSNPDRIGVAIGSGIGGISTIEKNHLSMLNSGPRKVSPFFVPAAIINMVAGYLSIDLGLRGPNFSIVTACTTGTHNMAMAARAIAYGDADAMITGGAECCSSMLGVAGFAAARALSKRNDDPEAASRPWDKDRDGFVLGDGAGVVVLEEYEHAKARGAHIYCELLGSGASGDAYHMTQPSEGGEGAARCMSAAIKDSQLTEDQIQYINAHGTSTQVGDVAETMAIKKVFGNAPDDLVVSSTKSMTGHLLGAAGGIEAIFSILALRDQVVPPTINLENPDEGCDLDYVPNTARDVKLKAVLSNSFGFGGTNGTLVFGQL